MILISGATGGIGGEICRLLKETGTPFRALCRKGEQVQDFQKKGIDAIIGDFDRPETLASALRGIETMFLITPEPHPMSKIAVDRGRRSFAHDRTNAAPTCERMATNWSETASQPADWSVVIFHLVIGALLACQATACTIPTSRSQ